MADGSPQTIDRIQVEFSTNINELLTDLGAVDQKLQSTTESFGSAEASSRQLSGGIQNVSTATTGMTTATNTAAAGFTNARASAGAYSSTMQNIGAYTTTATTATTAYTTSATRANTLMTRMTSTAKKYSTATTDVGKSVKYAVTQVGEYTVAANSQIAVAAAAAESMKKNAAETYSASKVAQDAVSGLKTALGMFGIGIGVGALVGQVKQIASDAEDASIKYGKMESSIYYSIGELSGYQKELAGDLVKQFDSSDVAEAISRITRLFPDAETTILENGKTALESIAEELLWLDAKDFLSLTSSNIDSMNSAFKKWNISTGDATLALSYLRAASQDTMVDMGDMLTYMTQLDEAGILLGMDWKQMVDFIGAANIAGNILDLSKAGTTFETQYGNKVESIKTALLANDREAVNSFIDEFNLDAEKISSMFSKVAYKLELDPTEAKAIAEDFAAELTQDIFQAVNQKAADIESKTSAASIWRNFLGLDGQRGGRIANALADFSISGGKRYENVSTTKRDTVISEGQTTTSLVLDEKGRSVSDANKFVEGSIDEFMKTLWFGKIGARNALESAAYIDAGYDPLFSKNVLGNMATMKDVFDEVIDYTFGATPLMNQLASAGSDAVYLLLKNMFPAEGVEMPDAGKMLYEHGMDILSQFFKGLSSSGSAEAVDSGEVDDLNDSLTILKDETLEPLNGTLETNGLMIDTVYQESILINDYSNTTLQPTLAHEKDVVYDLADAYWELAEAKSAAGVA